MHANNCERNCYKFELNINTVTQSKSKTQIARIVHCKFNCFTVKNNGTRHGIYIVIYLCIIFL